MNLNRRESLPGRRTSPSGTTDVSTVRKLFPDWRKEVSRLTLSDEAFWDLCEKYGRAVEALDRLEQRNRPHDVERMCDYRTLIRRLEGDLKYELLAARDLDRAPKP